MIDRSKRADVGWVRDVMPNSIDDLKFGTSADKELNRFHFFDLTTLRMSNLFFSYFFQRLQRRTPLIVGKNIH